MPKITRDQHCQRAINAFFRDYEFHYHLIKLNVEGYSIARYELTIPKAWEEHKPVYDSVSNNLTWNIETCEQELPNPVTICNDFATVFSPCEKPDAYLRIHIAEMNNEGITFKMLVKYFKSDLPFPPEETTMEKRVQQLELQNEMMSLKLRDYNAEIDLYVRPMKRRIHLLKLERDNAINGINQCSAIFLEQYSQITYQYRNMLRECYKDLNRKVDDCPVCYDPIEYENMFITPCKHHLCNDCAGQCKNSCPMCRQELCFIPP